MVMMAALRERLNGTSSKLLIGLTTLVITILVGLVGAWANAQVVEDRTLRGRQDQVLQRIAVLEVQYADISKALDSVRATGEFNQKKILENQELILRLVARKGSDQSK